MRVGDADGDCSPASHEIDPAHGVFALRDRRAITWHIVPVLFVRLHYAGFRARFDGDRFSEIASGLVHAALAPFLRRLWRRSRLQLQRSRRQKGGRGR